MLGNIVERVQALGSTDLNSDPSLDTFWLVMFMGIPFSLSETKFLYLWNGGKYNLSWLVVEITDNIYKSA